MAQKVGISLFYCAFFILRVSVGRVKLSAPGARGSAKSLDAARQGRKKHISQQLQMRVPRLAWSALTVRKGTQDVHRL
ncbi:hypothetical protein D0B32_15645 [Paraburkholderia sp. DHOC27]|nr:hypothetical protein D0B32_15645 [Paraburkholderia sp. DHOC27]